MTLRCPACGRRYEGEARFCTADGSRLVSAAPPPAEAPLAGRLLDGRYQVRARVAEGGMAIVYRADDVATGEALALKALAPVLTGDETAMARLRREAELGRQLRHPNVCPILAMGAAGDGVVYVVMPFLEGETLADRLARLGPLPPPEVARLVDDVAEGLHAAHALGIVHRDLKPENVMVVPGAPERAVVPGAPERAVVPGAPERAVVPGAPERAVVPGAPERAVVPGAPERAVVMDFGLATSRALRGAARRLTRTGMVMGTPEFMSPEQLRDQPLDARSDVYALALVTCELLTGRLPFAGRDQQEQMLARLRTAPMPLRDLRPDLDVPLEVERVMRRGLAGDREARYPTAPAFAAAFASALHGAGPAR